MQPHHYHVLGLTPDADAAAVKKAYRQAVLRCHPDLDPTADAHERFIEVHEAYHALMTALAPGQFFYRYVRETDARTPHEKYHYVYSAPTDPDAYAEWVIVARARAHRQAQERYEAFLRQRDQLKRCWYYKPVKWSTYAFYGLLFVLGAAFSLLPLAGMAYEQDVTQALSLTPLFLSGLLVFQKSATFKREVLDVYFKD
ncbi:MAG: J domain-containing protein [Catalinimonas sp.]